MEWDLPAPLLNNIIVDGMGLATTSLIMNRKGEAHKTTKNNGNIQKIEKSCECSAFWRMTPPKVLYCLSSDFGKIGMLCILARLDFDKL